MSLEKIHAAAPDTLFKPGRRLFLKQSLSLGALTMLTGCDATDPSVTNRILSAMSHWNDGVQAAIFNSGKLAPVYAESDITDPFPFNAFYTEQRAPEVAEAGFALELSGMIADKQSWTLERLRALPQVSQITRHICVEGWSAIGKWGGVSFGDFLRMVGADATARYVGFRCAGSRQRKRRPICRWRSSPPRRCDG